MNLEQLFALGATSTCGNIDLKGKNVGRLLAGGEVLISPEGEEVLAGLKPAVEADPVVVEAPAAKPRRGKKVVEPVAEPAPPAPEDDGLGDLLGNLE